MVHYNYRYIRFGGEAIVYTSKDQPKLIHDLYETLKSNTEANTTGYIHLTENYGRIIPINTRAILRVFSYKNEWIPKTNTRITLLDDSDINIRETEEEVQNLIIKATT